MMQNHTRAGTVTAILAAACIFCAFSAHAEQARDNRSVPGFLPSGGRAAPQSGPDAALEEGEGRDPFSPTRKLVSRTVKPALNNAFSETLFEPEERPAAIPKMRLRGHLRGKEGEVVALLEIQGGSVHIVREGDTVGLYDIGYDAVIRIKEISRLHLVIETGTYGKLIIVR